MHVRGTLLKRYDNHLGLINYIVMTTTFIFYYRACKAQGVDRRQFSYVGWFQPYCAYLGLVWMVTVALLYGYPSFKPWSVSTFFSSYTMQIFIPPLFIFWKVLKRTKFVKPHEADLVWERPVVDAYEASFIDPPVGFWKEMGQMIGIGRTKGGNERRFGQDGQIRQRSKRSDNASHDAVEA
jgi:amino acid transporter